MPELPEVEMVRRYLEATSLHQTIRDAAVLDKRIIQSDSSVQHLQQILPGLQFHSAYRHGKRLFLRLLEDLYLTLHLGLTGDLFYQNAQEAMPRHARFVVTFDNGHRLAFDDSRIFGEVGLTESPQSFLEERKIGPDALQISIKDFLAIMRGRKGIIKSALLNQSLVAGLGNLYADEALFQTGICPKSRGLDEAQLSDLFSGIQLTLSTALKTHADLSKLPDSFLLPHRHSGGKCPRDGEELKHEKIGGRTSYYCPKHQKMV
ncbi:MAG: Fpg/Nei family DNA glycosylase [Methanothrix sp.]|nr:MAG: Fpg/Nei family DNA glycosylase [Methanothrix sp.]